MKKLNLRGISEILTEKELKNVMGGSNTGGANCSLKCNNDTTTYWVSSCPSSTSEAMEICGDSAGALISCAC